jgi:hypothetical protein
MVSARRIPGNPEFSVHRKIVAFGRTQHSRGLPAARHAEFLSRRS